MGTSLFIESIRKRDGKMITCLLNLGVVPSSHDVSYAFCQIKGYQFHEPNERVAFKKFDVEQLDAVPIEIFRALLAKCPEPDMEALREYAANRNLRFLLEPPGKDEGEASFLHIENMEIIEDHIPLASPNAAASSATLQMGGNQSDSPDLPGDDQEHFPL